jgi:hypothetical protein
MNTVESSSTYSGNCWPAVRKSRMLPMQSPQTGTSATAQGSLAGGPTRRYRPQYRMTQAPAAPPSIHSGVE